MPAFALKRTGMPWPWPLGSQPFACGLRLFILATLVSLAAGCGKGDSGQKTKPHREEAVPVMVAEVALVPMDRTLAVVGTLWARSEAIIGAQVEGQLERTLVDFGNRVEARQELAFIDTTSYEALARQAAANVAKARASALNAEQNLKRILELQQSKISSASELDLATAQAEQARAEVKATEATEAIAQLNLERSRVKAPFKGAVSERIANAGDYVKTGAPLFRLVDDSELKFVVQAPERYAGQIQIGQVVQFTVDAWGEEPFEGRVFLVSPSVTISTRSFNLGALVSNAAGKLKASTFARGEVILERAVPTPVIPIEAVVNFAGVTKAFVIENGEAQLREIKVGRVRAGRQEVVEGLKRGEAVAISGQSKLYERAKVRVQPAEAKPGEAGRNPAGASVQDHRSTSGLT